jgi:fermentation-respiration switch protein FrsA (DUF1100 family)
MLRWFEQHQVFHPTTDWWETGDLLGRPWEDLRLAAADGTQLSAWFFPARPGSGRAHVAVLFCHGNGGNISHRLETYEALLETGVNLLAFDYRGYGRSQGRPDEAGTYSDAQAAHAWLRQRGFSASNIVAFGESLGGAVACELALRETLGGLVLQSTFTSIPEVGAELFPWLPVRWIARIKYDTYTKLPRVHWPVAVMHSRADTLIGFHHAQKLYAVANDPKLLCELAGDHNDMLEAGRGRFLAGLEKFLRLIEDTRPTELLKTNQR